MKLWHCVDARSMRCLWAIEELKLLGKTVDFELVTLPFPPRVYHKQFLKKNIVGTIPLLEDRGQKLTESNAISQYICDKYGPTSLTVKSNEAFYGEYLNWLHHGEATLTFPQTVVLRYTLQEPGRADTAAVDYARWFGARQRLLNTALGDGRRYLVGNRFTIADISVAYALYLGTTLKIDGQVLSSRYKPKVKEYMDRMLQRPGYLNARESQEISKDLFDSLLEESKPKL